MTGKSNQYYLKKDAEILWKLIQLEKKVKDINKL